MKPKYYITTPIYYVNDQPHIGHAYTTVACDVLARFKRLDGFDVMFLTGTDEHGQKVEKAAAAAGMEPQAFVDRVSVTFREMAEVMGISNDAFIRTTEARHKAACQALWRKLVAAGEIYLGGYEGWYAVRDEAFYDESELIAGPGGKKLAPTGADVEWVVEPSYFFRLSAWTERLLDFYAANPDFILPATRRNEVLGFVKGGLRDLSISRASFKWGIEVPDDPEHVMYVWLDALTNYITQLGYPDESTENWQFWPADLHMVGKDILRFHTVFWPAFLMAAGIAVPKRVFAHGWWLIEGEKMSKSLGNVIAPRDLVAQYGLDAVRYFMLREVPFGNDGDFSRKALISRLNVELANDLGNLAQRSLSLIARNCGGVLPPPGVPTEEDAIILNAANALPAILRTSLDRQNFHEALEEVWKVIRAGNAYIDKQAPWALKKTDIKRMEAVLRVLVDVLRPVATVLQPFMPGSMAKMLDQLGVPAEARDFAALATSLPGGTTLPAPSGVFPRFVEEVA
jgi:methionyl-tRNA synthetase